MHRAAWVIAASDRRNAWSMSTNASRLARAPYEGVHALADRAAQKRTDLAASILEITGFYEDLRYSLATSDRKKFTSPKKRIVAFRA